MHKHVACETGVLAMQECAMGLSASLGMRRNDVSLNNGAAAADNAAGGDIFNGADDCAGGRRGEAA